MKKRAFFAVVAVLMALVMVSCDLNPPTSPFSPTSNIVYDANGEPWGVNLTIGTPSQAGRALTEDNAKLYENYYEVAFMFGGKVYRTSWRKGQTGRIAVPFGDYSTVDPTAAMGTTGAAILFAGTYANRDLLAVGTLTKVNGGISTLIDSATTNVTFTLAALENDVKALSGSTFNVTTPPITPAAANIQLRSEGKLFTVPLFRVTKGVTNTATWAVSCPHNEGVFIQGAGSVGTYGFLTDAPIDGLKITPVITPEIPGPPLVPEVPALLPDSGALASPSASFTWTFNVDNAEGLAWLGFSVPVVALSDDSATSPGRWFIRGGVRPYEFDEGKTANSTGGGILVGTQAYTGPIDIYTD